MSQQAKTQQKWAVASVALQEAYTDFILSRQAILCSEQTVIWYGKTAGKFVTWLEEQSITSASEITSPHPRAYLVELAGRHLASSTIHGHARAIKTFTRFCHSEGYLESQLNIRMPKVERKKHPTLSVEELKQLIRSCKNDREKAAILMLADTGIRQGELIALNWGDIDIKTGYVSVLKGKGGNYRRVVLGIKARRGILKYRRSCEHHSQSVFLQTVEGKRFSKSGFRSFLLRIGKSAEVHLTAHMLRRTFATLSLRNGMNLIELQGLLGHSSLSMTEQYVSMLAADYANAHRRYGPIDNL